MKPQKEARTAVYNKEEIKQPESVAAAERKKLSFNATEAYKTIQMNVVFMLSQSEHKSFVVSSVAAGEGKSTTTVNLARTFAQMGNRVLLVDADLRKPSVHRKMKLSNAKGLSSVLVGFCSADEAIQKIENNLDVITSGPIPPNQTELLCSTAMKVLARGLEERYNYVIYDTPPFGIVSDALVLSPLTAGSIVVVRSGMANLDGIKKSKSIIESSGSKVLGYVLNDVKQKNSKYKYYNKKKYDYYYYYGNYADKQS